MKNKVFSFINIFGLSAGLACCMLIALYIYNETTYDDYHKHGDTIYQLGTTFLKKGDKNDNIANTPAPMAQGMKREFPEVMAATHLLGLFADDKTLLQYGNINSAALKSFYETKGYLGDSNFFRMFDYHFIEGNESALDKPSSIVLSEEIAKKIFGNETAINKVIHVNSNTHGAHDFTVRGVYRPVNKPSHIAARFFLTVEGGDMEQYINRSPNDYATNNMFFSYLRLKPGTDYKKLEKKFPAFIDKHAGKDLQAMGFGKKQFLIPLKSIHLTSLVKNNVTPLGSKTYLYILGSIALFTLLIACINFMNLSTARSSKRSAEVGIRKVMGAEKSALIKQFLGESLLMSLLAFVFALILLYLLLPLFSQISGKTINISLLQNAGMLAGFFVLAIITGFIAGSYPAFYLSSFMPVKVLKGRITNSLAAASLRKGLVVFQFVISVILIIASIVIASQMKFLKDKDLGFAKDQQLVIPLRSVNGKNAIQPLKDALKNNPQVLSSGACMYYPGIFNPSDNLYYREGQTMNDGKRTRVNYVDYDFLKTLGVQAVAGRVFSKEFPTDTSYKVVINERLVQELGFPNAEKTVGQHVKFDWQGETYRFQVVGVLKDFNFEDLKQPLSPFAFQVVESNPPPFNYLLVHANTTDMKSLLTSLEKEWKKLNPNESFEYSMLDDDFMKNYEAENRLAALVGYFTVIAILISCLGLFGLATFSAEQRIKEIGVRKVLGATEMNLITLLSKDFLKLVIVASIIASPVAWWIMQKWLQGFAYRTGIGWQVFVITILSAVILALITISFKAIKAAMANPVKSLRTE